VQEIVTVHVWTIFAALGTFTSGFWVQSGCRLSRLVKACESVEPHADVGDTKRVNISVRPAHSILSLDVVVHSFAASYERCLLNMGARAVRWKLRVEIDKHNIRIVKDGNGMLMSRQCVHAQMRSSHVAFGKRKSTGNIVA
jgi:hypothetical protein